METAEPRMKGQMDMESVWEQRVAGGRDSKDRGRRSVLAGRARGRNAGPGEAGPEDEGGAGGEGGLHQAGPWDQALRRLKTVTEGGGTWSRVGALWSRPRDWS